MNIREPERPIDGDLPRYSERYCYECRAMEGVAATHVIDVRYGQICLCDNHFTELAIALSLAVTEEHPE